MEHDVLLWLQCFRCFGTGQNYVSALYWSCVATNTDLRWYGMVIKTAMKGLRKSTRQALEGLGTERASLTETQVETVCKFWFSTNKVQQVVGST